jgi:uncharacterized protein YciI
MGFWEQKVNNQANMQAYEAIQSQEPMALDEEAVAEIQEEHFDILEEDEDDTTFVMADANLRLEMGRLYQMILQNDIFAQTNADPRAIKNVQREIRRLVREKMETMLGIRQEQPTLQQTVVSSPFNDMEVSALKMLASKITKGATEEVPYDRNTPVPAPQPKKDGITAISGTIRPQQMAPIKAPEYSRPVPKKAGPAPKKQETKRSEPLIKSAIANPEGDSLLNKPIEEMSQEELAEYERQALDRRAKNKAAMPANLVPHPSPQELEMKYMAHAQQFSAVANTIALLSGNR